MSVQVGRWPCLHAGDSSPEGCCGFCPLASCSLLSPRCQAPTSQVKNQEQIVAGEELLMSPQPQLPALTPLHGWEEGESSRAGHAGMSKQAGKGNLHTHRLHKDRDEVRAGTRLEVRPQHVQRQSQRLIPWKSCSGKQLWKGRLLQLHFELTPG